MTTVPTIPNASAPAVAPTIPKASATAVAPPTSKAHTISTEGAAPYLWGVVRLMMGWIFLWPFLDKAFGLGHDTTSAGAWIHGGSPTTGFLKGSVGPFSGIYHSMAGSVVADWGFMIALLLIGVALLSGIGVRVAAIGGAVLLVLMWSASLPPANNPFMDEHLIYALVLIGLAPVSAGSTLGLGRWWTKSGLGRDHAWLR